MCFINASGDPAASPATTTGKVKPIANFAVQHFKAAKTFRKRLEDIEAKNADKEFRKVAQIDTEILSDIRSYGSGCIMSAAASLEALINELYIEKDNKLHKAIVATGDFDEIFWGNKPGIEYKSALTKYICALKRLGLTEIVDEFTSSHFYKNAELALELRNSLIHFKPMWDRKDNRKLNLVRELVALKAFTTSRFVDGSQDFLTYKCMSADCARWVIESISNFVVEFDNKSRAVGMKLDCFKL